MSNKIKFGNIEIDPNQFPLKNIAKYFGFFVLALFLITSIYTVDANENAVILRFGKFYPFAFSF